MVKKEKVTEVLSKIKEGTQPILLISLGVVAIVISSLFNLGMFSFALGCFFGVFLVVIVAKLWDWRKDVKDD